MSSVTVIFTCYNRLEKTKKCIETIQDDKADIRFIITDDNSSDGTDEYLEGLKSEYPDKYTILHGNGNLFWSGGMRNGIGFYLDKGEKTDYVALINDDVVFEHGILSYMVCRSKTKNNAVIAGATANKNGGISYGGVEYIKGTVKCGIIPLEDANAKNVTPSTATVPSFRMR